MQFQILTAPLRDRGQRAYAETSWPDPCWWHIGHNINNMISIFMFFSFLAHIYRQMDGVARWGLSLGSSWLWSRCGVHVWRLGSCWLLACVTLAAQILICPRRPALDLSFQSCIGLGGFAPWHPIIALPAVNICWGYMLFYCIPNTGRDFLEFCVCHLQKGMDINRKTP